MTHNKKYNSVATPPLYDKDIAEFDRMMKEAREFNRDLDEQRRRRNNES